MRLSRLSESMLSHKLREHLNQNNYFSKPGLHTIPLYNPIDGTDSDSKATSSTTGKAGIPSKRRHRKYFGMNPNAEEIQINI